jgi:prophage antirepressor-like protein
MEQVFENRMLNASVRAVKDKGEVFFYAKDVAKALGYKRPKDAVRTHVWEEDKYTLKDLEGGGAAGTPFNSQPNTVFISEQGLYQLIFGSELERAKEFRRWVFKEVLPSIRKTGTYTAPNLGQLKVRKCASLTRTTFTLKLWSTYVRTTQTPS